MATEYAHMSKLSNGATIITVPMPMAESVSFGIFVSVGSRFEKAAESGASHFIEHMLFKGTATRSAIDISRMIEGVGGAMNAYTSEDGTCYYVRVPHECIKGTVKVFMDMFLRSAFKKIDVDRERGVILEEMKMYEDQPETLAMINAQEAMFPNHPLGVPGIGNTKSLKSLTSERLLAYKKRLYAPANTVFVFSGRIDHDQARNLIEGEMGEFKKRVPRSCVQFDPAVPPRRLTVIRKDVQQVQLVLSFRSCSIFDPRIYTLRILDMMLGGCMSSRLFQAVRERRGLCYSINTISQPFAEIGAFSVCCGVEPDKSFAALKLIVKELLKIRSRKPGSAELLRTKRYINGTFRMALESVSAQMSYYGRRYSKYGDCLPPEDVVRRIEEVGAEEVRAVAESIFVDGGASLAVVIPENFRVDEAEWLEALRPL